MSAKRESGAPNLDPLFSPRSIAIVGASNVPGKMGNLFAARLKAGFRGLLYAVNPGSSQVAGIPCYASVNDLPEPIDLMLALLPGAALVDLIEQCEPNKVRFLAAIPSGFAEAEGDGKLLQERLRLAALAKGACLLGPNIVGVMNCETGLNASMIPDMPPGGQGLSCLTQSGGFGMALSMYALDHAVPVAKFCDLGNMAGLEVADVLAYLGRDPSTRVIGLFLESVHAAQSFTDVLAAVARQKPVVLVALGLTEAGRRASRAHLGLMPNLEDLGKSLPAGVIAASTAEELFSICKALLLQRCASGSRIAILTGTGGIGAELADLSIDRGLDSVEFSDELQSELRQVLPPYAAVGNPIDATPIWQRYHDVYPYLIRCVDRSGEVDGMVVSITDVATTLPELARSLIRLQPELRMPISIYWGSRDRDLGLMHELQAAGYPCYRTTRGAIAAIGALCRPIGN